MSTAKAGPPTWTLLLAPGAGADRDQAALVALDQVATGAGAKVRRMDFAYRKAGRRAPDRPPVLLQAVLDEAAAVGGPAPLVLGGRSMGGRICSIAVATSRSSFKGDPASRDPASRDPTSDVSAGPRLGPPFVGGLPVAGLLLISYPLHPPGRPEKLRTEHFSALDVPCLFVSGTRDAFGTPAELEAATAAIPGPVTHHWVEGKDHAMRNTDGEVGKVALAWLADLGLAP